MLRRSDGGDSFAEFPALGREVPARRIKSFRAPARGDAPRIPKPAALFAELHHVQRLPDMQRARLAVGSHAVVIEDAIRNVRVLLNFAQHDAGTNRVRGPGWHENGVARMDRHAFKT